MQNESIPLRYTDFPLPRKKYIPGKGIHPKKDPKSFRVFQVEFSSEPFNPGQWEKSDKYLYAVDLFNYGYWWEAHEIFELLWIETGRTNDLAKFFQGIIQIAAALLRKSGSSEMPPILNKAFANLSKQSGVFLGIEISLFLINVKTYFNQMNATLPRISLLMES